MEREADFIVDVRIFNDTRRCIGAMRSSVASAAQLRGARFSPRARLRRRELPPLLPRRARRRRAASSPWTRRPSRRTAGRSCTSRACCATPACTRREVHAQDLAQGFLLLYRPRHAHLPAGARRGATPTRCSPTRSTRWCAGSSRAAPGELPPYDEALLRRELRALSRLVRRAGTSAERSSAAQQAQRSKRIFAAARRQRLAQPHGLRAPRLHAAQPDGVRAQPGRARFPGRGARPDHLRHGVAAARCVHQLGGGARARLDACATGRRRKRAGCRSTPDFGEFWRDFEWMGLQRHLKVLGIFARLHYRDGKPSYLDGHAALPGLRARRRRALPRARAARRELLRTQLGQ